MTISGKRKYYNLKQPLSTVSKHRIARALGLGEEFEFVAYKFNIPLIYVLEVRHEFRESIEENLVLRKNG